VCSNCVEIYNYNSLVLDSLNNRLRQWSYSQKLSDIFIKMVRQPARPGARARPYSHTHSLSQAPYMKLYEQYCNSYDGAIAIAAKLRERPLTNKFLQGIMQSDTATNPLPLEALLIMPVQRLPRYMYAFASPVRHTLSLASMLQVHDILVDARAWRWQIAAARSHQSHVARAPRLPRAL